jgi:hypothetical protein
MALRLPQVRLAVIEEAGHGWNAEFVRRQLDVLTAFLDGRPLPEQALAPQAVTATA